MLRLGARFTELVGSYVAEPGKPARDVLAAGPTSVVFVQHHEHKARGIGVLANQFLLSVRHRAAHQGDDPSAAVLMKFDNVKESFDDHQRFVRRFLYGSIYVEQFEPFSESRREFVLRRAFRRFTRPTTGISHNLTIDVVNRDDDVSRHQSLVAGK